MAAARMLADRKISIHRPVGDCRVLTLHAHPCGSTTGKGRALFRMPRTLSASDESATNCSHGGLDPILHLQLAEDGGDMVLDCVLAQVEGLRDLGVVETRTTSSNTSSSVVSAAPL